MAQQQKTVATHVDGQDNAKWTRWVMQTARSWDDITGIINKTGIDSIDLDHRQMTEVVLEINNLIDIYESGKTDLKSIREQGRVLETLYAFAERHFTREINIIEKYDLPNLDEQKSQHGMFLNMLQGYIDDFNEGRLAVSLNLKSAVLEWWVGHINDVDTRTFNLENWTKVAIDQARNWEDVAEIIRPMGNELLDLEHKEMTEIALGLFKYTEQDNPEIEAVENVIVNLIDCAERHFRHEEGFLKTYGLPDIHTQENQHKKFLSLLEDMRQGIRNGQRDIDRSLQSTILQWWVNHINVVDYNAFSLEKQGFKILSAARSWHQAMPFVHCTGNQQVDRDHQLITEHIISIDDLMDQEQHASPAEAAELGRAFFETMFELCKSHFEHEEAQMQNSGYSGFHMHKEQHDRFLVALNRHREDFSCGRAVASKHMKNFILKWWVDHIKELDMRAFGGRDELASEWDVLGGQSSWNCYDQPAKSKVDEDR